jgi:hypothetical protein
MSLKTGGKVLGVFEAIIYAISFIGWAALGFPYFKTVAAFGCLAIICIAVYKWIAYRNWF